MNDTLGLNTINWLLIIKTVSLVFLFVYFFASLVVIKQIRMMSKTIMSDTNKYIFFIGYLHMFIVLAILLYALIVI